MKKLLLTSLITLALQTGVFASVYSNINVSNYNISNAVANSYIRGVIAQGDVTRWNPAYFPLKVYIQTSNVPPEYVQQLKRAYMDWQRVTDNNITFRLVGSPSEADLKCIFVNDIPDSSEDTVGIHHFKYMGDRIADSTIYFRYTSKYGLMFDSALFYTIALHEIGHSLGLAGHSSNSKDLMYPVTSSRDETFSKRDITTLKLLYSMVPDRTNIPFSSEQTKRLFTKAQVIGGESRQKEDAETAAEINKRITPDDPNTRVRLALAYQENGNYTGAITEYKAAVVMIDSPDVKSQIYCQIAECYIAMRNFTAARNCATFTNSKYPSDYSAILPAKITYKQGHTEVAVRALLPLWNNYKNQWAGQLLKEIYDNSDKKPQIRKLIEREMRF